MNTANSQVPQENVEINSTKKSFPIIKIIVGLLILIIVSEVAYLAYNQYYLPSQNEVSLSGPSIESNSNQTEPTQNTDVDSTNPNPPTTINQDFIEQITPYIPSNRVAYESMTLSYTIKGEVVSSSTPNEIQATDDSRWLIVIKNQIDGNETGIFFNSTDLLNTIVIDASNPEQKTTVRNIKTGDDIAIHISTVIQEKPIQNTTIQIL